MSRVEPSTSAAAAEFREFLDSVCTPIDATKPLFDPNRDYAQEKHNKQERYRHNYLMENSFWYRNNYLENQRLEAEMLKAKTQGKEWVEPEQKTLGEEGFWEQF